jgi:dephospho-CoA kinase
MRFLVGLTGGIGSGKTTVADQFAELGADLVDTDRIAHDLTAVGGSALIAIARRFGDKYLTDAGALDRERMRALVFSDPAAKKDLESILHPMIRSETARLVSDSVAPYTMLVVPLLFETGDHRERVQRVVVVDCDEQTQIDRVVRRSRLRPEEVRAIMATQISRAQRLEGADDVIRNDTDIDGLRPQVALLHRKYLELAART